MGLFGEKARVGENLKKSNDKVAVVIGATGNLGRAVVLELENSGFSIDATWNASDRPDATNPNSYLKLPKRVDAAIYLAGINVVKDIEVLSEDDWDRVLNVNLRGAYLFAKAVLPSLKNGSDATFITISSIMATHPYPGRTAYATAKAGIEGLTRALAVEWGPYGIATHSIRLGHLVGLMKSTVANPQLLAAVKESTPSGHLIEPNEVAKYINWLCTGGAKAVSGSVIDFDPAYTLNRWPLK